MKEILIGRMYRHYKNKDYIIIDIAQHSETLEKLVVYKALYGENLTWVRPYDMFIENVEYNGEVTERFKLVNDKDI